VAKVELEIDRLFELPREEFVGARNELARLLKKEGKEAAAEEVKQPQEAERRGTHDQSTIATAEGRCESSS
jgi:hypothetical protein